MTAARTVAVIGAGIVGTLSALELARRGCEVTLIGTRPPRGASWRSFSWINSAANAPADYRQLRALGMARYQELAASTRFASAIRFPGILAFDDPTQAAEGIQGYSGIESPERTYDRVSAEGGAVELLSRERALRLEPLLDPAALPDDGILWTANEGWVDLPTIIGEATTQFLEAGGRLVLDDSGATLELSGRRAAGARLSDGSVVGADVVLVAAGAQSPALVADALSIPDDSRPAVLIRTRPVAARPRRMLRAPRASVRADEGGRLVVQSLWVETMATLDGDRVDIPEDAVRAVLDTVAGYYRHLGPLEPEVVGTGLRPVPGGGLPAVGPVPGLDGAYLAFTHSGATLAPALADVIADELADGATSPLLASFRPARFA